MKCGIYEIINKINGKKYIGSSSNLNYRKNSHFRDLKNNKHHCKYLQNSYNKYGNENFTFNIIEIINYNEDKIILKDNLLTKEQFYIDKFKNDKILYNECLIAGSCLGRKLTKEHKRKLSESKKSIRNPQYGRKYTDEEKDVLRQYSLNMSKESREKISKAGKGNNYRLGKKQSKESRKKISDSNKGKHNQKRSDETRKKISNAVKGRIVSEETKSKKSLAMFGKKRNKDEKFKGLINNKKRNEILLKNENELIYCFNMKHASIILNIDARRIQKAYTYNRKCLGYDILQSNENFYDKTIMLNNLDLFTNDNIPNNKLVELLKMNFYDRQK
jgi:hypothetical protein